MPPILIAEATERAVRTALLRHRCHTIITGQPPYQHAGEEARAVAGSLSRALALVTILRGGRRPAEVRLLEQRAAALEARLAEMVPASW